MCNEALGSDLLVAWPTAELGLMGIEGAVAIIYRKEIAASPDPNALQKKRIEEFAAKFGRQPYHAAAHRRVDDIIAPQDTRKIIIQALETFGGKTEDRPWRKHSNMPF